MRLKFFMQTFAISFFLLFSLEIVWGQTLYRWPVTPFDQSHEITGNFSEFRDTGSADHFHNGTDIPKPDGSPVYPVKDGIVTAIGTTSAFGSDAYVRIQDVAYVHIAPNPALSVGDSVFVSATVLGTILSGLGHVHFTNGFVGSEKNSMLPNSGLTPLSDPWPPIIRSVRFFINNTTSEFPTHVLSGLVDILVQVDEQNGPPSSSISRRNNGTYKIGYKILSADSSTVIFEPPNDGVRFQFDTKPSNTHVHRVFSDQLSSTSRHVYIVTNDVAHDNYWNTSAIPEDHYVVMVFAEDTRQNADTVYVAVETTDADLVAPAQPVLRFVKEIPGGMNISWFANTDEDLTGYRLEFSFDNSQWSPFASESSLSASEVDTSINQIVNQAVYFRITAVDDAPVPNESITSDVYGMTNGDFPAKVLIVDGFDRTEGGGWTLPNHYFAFTHGKAVLANGLSFDTASNDAVLDSSIYLSDYRAVIWILGDESTVDETFSPDEQALVKTYLENGGMLFLSGSQIAWDLDQDNTSGAATPSDEEFLHEFLRADYVGDDSGILSVTGVAGTIFEGLAFDFGTTPYSNILPDVIVPFEENAAASLKYSAGEVAGIQYEGLFGAGNVPGKLVYLAFPFETITGEENREEVMGRVLNFFFPVTAVMENHETGSPSQFALLQNYPNPFNPETSIEYHLPVTSHVILSIFNMRGQKIRTLVDETAAPGKYEKIWDGRDLNGTPLASGMYVARIHAEASNPAQKDVFEQTRMMMLVK